MTQIATNTGAIEQDNPGQYHTLSDGTGVIIYRNSVVQASIRHTVDHVNYTLMNTWSPASWGSGRLFGATIDELDNIHFCWVDGTNTVKYVKFTKSAGPTWTAGSTETVGSCTLSGFSAPKIEVGASGVVLVAWTEYASALPSITVLTRFRMRHTGGAWGAESTETVPITGNLSSFRPTPPSIARDAAGIVGTTQAFAVLTNGGAQGSGMTIPFRLVVKKFTVATGAVASTTLIDAGPLGGANGQDVEAAGVFTATPGRWQGGGVVKTGSTRTYYAFEMSDTAYVAGPSSSPTTATAVSATGVSYVQNRLAFVENETSGNIIKVKHAAFASSVAEITFLSRYTWDGTAAAGPLYRIISGQNRNGQFGLGDVVLHNTGPGVHVIGNPANTKSATMVSPFAGGIVTTNNVPLVADPYETGDKMQKPRFEISTSSSFVTSSFLEGPDSTYKFKPPGVGITLPQVIAPNGLFSQGTWYVRVRAMDPWGRLGPNSSSNMIVVTHSPLAVLVEPEPNKTSEYAAETEIAWTFSDGWPSDSQSAYQVVIERNDTSATVLNTGKLVAAGGLSGSRNSHMAAIPSSLKGVELRVKVAVWDTQDIGGTFGAYSIFTLADPPVVAITAPAAGVLNNPTPTVTWTFTADGGRVQAGYQVTITKVDGTVVYDSGVLSGAATSLVPAVALANLTDYVISVRAFDNTSGALQDTDTVSILTTWTPAADTTSATVDYSDYAVSGFVQIAWTNATRDADFYSWQVWRTDGVTGEQKLIHETRSEASTFAFNDYLVANNRPYFYDVIQTAVRFGTVVPGPLGSPAQLEVPPGALVQEDYWLIYEHDPNYNVALRRVKEDKFIQNEIEREEIHLHGRGRKFDYGTEFGPKGQLTAQIWDWFNPAIEMVEPARDVAQRLNELHALKATVWLRNPFGDLWMVSMGDVDVSRLAGVGALEYVDVTIPYAGVA